MTNYKESHSISPIIPDTNLYRTSFDGYLVFVIYGACLAHLSDDIKAKTAKGITNLHA